MQLRTKEKNQQPNTNSDIATQRVRTNATQHKQKKFETASKHQRVAKAIVGCVVTDVVLVQRREGHQDQARPAKAQRGKSEEEGGRRWRRRNSLLQISTWCTIALKNFTDLNR